jgi:hypothetical protein
LSNVNIDSRKYYLNYKFPRLVRRGGVYEVRINDGVVDTLTSVYIFPFDFPYYKGGQGMYREGATGLLNSRNFISAVIVRS